MANLKINQSELISRLADRAEFVSKADAARFVAALEESFTERLLADHEARLGGIGVFRLQWVEPRKSVDVRTGNQIEIAGHYKLAFVPDAALKNSVNSVAIDDDEEKNEPLQKLSEQAAEINALLADINGADEAPAEPELESQPAENEEESVPSESEVTPEPEPVPVVEPEPEPEPAPVVPQPSPTTQDNIDILIKVKDNKMEKDQTEQPKRRSHAWIWILIVVLLLCGGVAAWYFCGDVIRTWTEARWQTVSTWCSDTWNGWFGSDEQEPAEEVEVAAEESAEEENIFAQPRTYDEFIGNATIKKGVHLAIIAEQNYGHKDFWVYIYEANRDVLTNPNEVEVGTKLRLPKMDERLVDASNPDAVAFAQQLADQYLQK